VTELTECERGDGVLFIGHRWARVLANGKLQKYVCMRCPVETDPPSAGRPETETSQGPSGLP